VATNTRPGGTEALLATASRRSRAVATSLATIGLLFVVALGSRSVSFPPSEPDPTSPSTPGSLIGYLALLAAPVIVAGLVGLVIVLVPQGRSKRGEDEKRATLFPSMPWWLRLAAIAGSLVIIAIPITLVIRATGSNLSRPKVLSPGTAAPYGQTTETQSAPPPFRVDWAPVAVVTTASAVVLGVFVLSHRRRRSGPGSSTSAERVSTQVRHAIVDSIADLRAERDARRAVIAAYARMEHDLSGVGIPRRPSETAPEYLDRVLTRVDVSPEAAGRLTRLFERAKFGGATVDDQMKGDALACLERVAAEVGGS
jgi:hypothetical protein